MTIRFDFACTRSRLLPSSGMAAAFVVAMACLGAGTAQASSGGITGRTNLSGGAGCAGGGCHSDQAQDTSTMTVTITGPAGLNANATGTYTITATRAANASSNMGINVAASQGTLGTNGAANLQVVGGELTHKSSGGLVVTNLSGTGSYSFTYQMPAGAGGTASTIYGVSRIALAGGWRHAANLTVATRPAAPTIGTGTPGNGSASVAFTAPANGGSAITGYTANCGGFTGSGGASPVTVSGLTNGTPYSCSVTATNLYGTSVASGTVSVTPRTVPGAPTIGTATPGNAQISVTFSAPASNGGSTITGYTANCGGTTNTGGSSPIVVPGLVNGTPYTCTVTAQNVAGSSGASAASNSVTPRTVPGAPTIGVATPGNAQISVTFSAPASNGGSAITGYTANCGGTTNTGASSPIVVPGLVNGSPYTCTVTAQNVAGSSLPSAASNSATPFTFPNPPTIGSVQPGNGSATVSFSAPAFDGGSPITSYTATCGAFTATGPSSPLVVNGLTNGTPYSCTVTATNAAGPSAPSTAVGVTPTADPDGRLDPVFGTAGLSPAFFSGAGESARAIVVDRKQRIVVGGAASSAGIVYLAVARFTPAGAFDPDFGSGGIFLIEPIGPNGAVEGLALDDQGRILFAGASDVSGNNATFTIGRLLPDGGLDESFAKGGYLKLPQASATQGLARTIAHDAKRGIIHAAGWDKVSGQSFNAIVVRLDDTGALDGNFGNKGILSVPLGVAAGGLPEGAVTGLAIDSLGRAVMGGFADFGSNFNVFAMRADEKGLDASFGTAGIAIHDTGGTTDVAFSMRLDEKDRANLVGYTNAAGQFDMLVTRFDPDGAFESDIVSDQGGLQTDFGTALVITPDGKRLAGGMRNAGGTNSLDFAFARFLDGGGLDPGFGGSGRVSLPNSNTDQLIAMQPHGPGTVVGLVQTGGQQRLARFAIEAPLPFAFSPASVTSVGTTTLVQSNAVALQGLAGETYVTVQGGEWSRNCAPGTFTAGDGVAIPGDSVCVRHVTAALAGQTVVTTLTVGGQSATFSSTPNAVVPPKTLTVTKAGGGAGVVASSPGGISCGATCSSGFPTNQPVTLFASPVTGSVFTGWNGACTGTGNCNVTMDVARNVTATFAVQQFTLTVSNPNAQRGTVTSNPGTIACGVLCAQAFDAGTVVTLTASPSPNFQFAGWTGGGCSGTGTCQVTMNANVSVSASFTAVPVNLFTLTVGKTGGGGGLVTSTPSGIDCGATCNADFNSGVMVALGAAPASDSFFAGWSGACTGTGACNVTMDAAKSVTATFKLNTTIPRLANISTRMQVLTGNDVLIGGFIIGGSAPKTVVVRARGPSLIPLGVPNAITNPRLDLFSGQTVIASSTDWGANANAAAIQASGFAPSSPQEAAILTTLTPGAYTAIVSGEGGVTGVGIIEVFEVDHPEVPLANISTRGQVLTGGDVMIGGFIIQGDAPQTVVVRARGPSLAAFGIANFLGDPVLQLFSGPNVIASNDDWQLSPDAANIQARGFAPADAKEAVILITLPPGAYTAIVSGKNGGTGVGIIEVFAQ